MTAPDFDALIERLSMVRVAYALAAERDHDMQIGNSDVSMQSKMFADAAAALVQLRDHNAQMASDEKILQRALDAERSMRQRAEAEVARLSDKYAEEVLKRAEALELLERATEHIAALEAERDALTVEFRKVEVLWKEAAIDASRKHDTIGGLENACRISLSRIDALQAENKLLRECARTPDLERIDAAIDAAAKGPT